jgi:hypothetical protein
MGECNTGGPEFYSATQPAVFFRSLFLNATVKLRRLTISTLPGVALLSASEFCALLQPEARFFDAPGV